MHFRIATPIPAWFTKCISGDEIEFENLNEFVFPKQLRFGLRRIIGGKLPFIFAPW